MVTGRLHLPPNQMWGKTQEKPDYEINPIKDQMCTIFFLYVFV